MASHVTEMHIPVKTTRLFFQLTIFMSFIAGFASTASPTPVPTQAAWVKVFRDVFGGPVGSGNAALSCGNFYHGGSETIYCASADLMERNLYHRIEIAFPINDKQLAKRVKSEGLDVYLKKTSHRWTLKANGEYRLSKSKQASNTSAQMTNLNSLNKS